jgi:hypothetical protein
VPQAAEETYTWTKYNIAAMTISVVGYFVFVLAYSAMFTVSAEFYGVAVALFSRGTFWCVLFLALGMSTLLNYTAEYVRREFLYTVVDAAMERDR